MGGVCIEIGVLCEGWGTNDEEEKDQEEATEFGRETGEEAAERNV